MNANFVKNTFFSLLLSVVVATTATAQAGWGSSDSWDAPKKSPAKKATAPGKSAALGRQVQAAGKEQLLQNVNEPAKAEVSPGNTASMPPDNSLVPGAFGGSTQSNNDRQGMSVAPGTPVMLQSGRNVLRDDAIAARERRLRRTDRAKAASIRPAPTLVGAEGTMVDGGNQAAVAVPTTGTGGAVMGAEGSATGAKSRITSPIGRLVDGSTGSASGAGTGKASGNRTNSSKATPGSKPLKKALAVPAGW